jgi:hypothetical protein
MLEEILEAVLEEAINFIFSCLNEKEEKPIPQLKDPDCERLQLKEPFTREQLKEAYRRLSEMYHPDRGGNTDSFILLNQSYKKLLARLENQITE